PTRPSRMEDLIAASVALDPPARARAEALRQALIAAGVTKYNVGAAVPEIAAAGRLRVLVPGQVEDDASIRLGTTEIRTNAALLAAARAAFPDAYLIYKPHPDVEIGLRQGKVDRAETLADWVAENASAADLLASIDVVWTMTSLMGFEALLRGRAVHCLGRPFYAGWGLTVDHGQSFPRRTARPDLLGLIHAALIDYPRYFDPVTRRATSAEIVLARLAEGGPAVSENPARRMRWLAAAQYRARRFAPLWRR
ncbi:MAG: capsular polysaccharide biosynthesis protein, partial [Pseudomonadota bacterium]